jgi:S1-C subfamily serine protease
MSAIFLALGTALLAGGQGGGGKAASVEDEYALARVARSMADRIVQVEVVSGPAGDRVLLSHPAVVIGPGSIMTIAPKIASRLASPGASLRIRSSDGTEHDRLTPASLVRADLQTGLAVVKAEAVGEGASPLAPAALPRSLQGKKLPVVVIQPQGGKLILRRGELIQARAYLDQGRGNNPLLLVRLETPAGAGEGTFGRWEDDTASGAGCVLTDQQGRFLGIVTQPVLGANEARSEEQAKRSPAIGARPPADPPKFQPKDGEILALPAEIARTIADSLSKGKAPVRGYFGASFRETPDPPEEVRRLGSAAPGVRVEKVYPGGPADQGGLQPGDWLIALFDKGGVTYADVVRFSELVEYGGQGKTVPILVARGSPGHFQIFKLKVRIGWR